MPLRDIAFINTSTKVFPRAVTLAVLVTITAMSTAISKDALPIIEDLAPETANEALVRIPDLGRKLLALRSYLRAGAKLDDRWSWTKEEIEEFEGSTGHKMLNDAVARIDAHFRQANPGYSLHANTNVRSLDLQIKRWNANDTVGNAAQELLDAWKAKFGPLEADNTQLKKKAVRNWLARYRGTTRAPLAAPGLSRHGQASAVDFQIKQGDTFIATPKSRTAKVVWDAQGWDKKLKESVEAAGPNFDGPLLRPYEPWHYNYDPAAVPVE